MSSLEKQLKRLRIPDSSSLERATKFKKKTSFLFDPKEASDIDNETVFSLALNGLDELKLVNLQFEKFETVLFTESSKYLERTLQSQELNDKLDNNIKDYLRFLSPYILLKPAHKTLEWLIRRYQVHLYNIDDLLACVFPYHQSNVFARVVQLLNIANTKWSWLTSVQKSGCPLPRSTIIQHCISNPAFFTFLSGLVFNIGKSKANQAFEAYHVFCSFYASTVIGVLDRLDRVSEEIVTSLLAQVIHGLKSNVTDLQAASYMIIAQMTTKCVLEASVIESLLKVMCKNASVELSESLLMCINHLCSSHKVMKFPKVVYQTLCELPNMGTILPDLSKRYQMDSFLRVLIFHLLKKFMNGDSKETELLNLLKDVDINETTRMAVIRHVLNEYIISRGSIEDETSLVGLESSVGSIVRIIQKRWQREMDKTVQDYLVGLRKEEISENDKKRNLQWTQDFVSMALSSIGSQVVCDSGSTLVIALHHPEAEYRKLALKKVSDILKEPLRNSEDNQFLKESLLIKLNDEDPTVVSAVLELSEGLVNVCGGEPLVLPLISLMEKSSQQWPDVFEKALNIFVNNEMLERMSNTTETVLFHLLPFVFLKKKCIDRAKLVVERLGKSQLKSHWMVKSLLKKSFREGFESCVEDSTFEELAVGNFHIISAIVKGITSLENQSALKTLKMMQEHANIRHDQTFVIMSLMVCCEFVDTCKDDSHRFEAISLFLPKLLALVSSVAENERKSKVVKDSHGGDFEVQHGGIIPVGLLANYLHMLKRKKEKKLVYVTSKIYLNIIEHVLKCLPPANQQSSLWWNISNDHEKEHTKILLAVFDVIFKGLVQGQEFSFHDEFKCFFETVVKTHFPQRLQFVKFLTFLWSSSARQESANDPDGLPVPSALVIIQSLNVAKVLIQSLDDQDMVEITSDNSQVFPSLLVCLTSPVSAVRQTVVDVISLITSRSTEKTSVLTLGRIVFESSEEIIADETFIASVFQSSIFHESPESSGRRKSKSKKRSANENMIGYLLAHIVKEETPSHVARVLLATLVKIDTEDFLIMGHTLMEKIMENFVKSQDCSFDHGQMLLYFIQKFTPRTAGLLKTHSKICEMFLRLLGASKPLFHGQMTPQEAALNQITAEYFEATDEENVQGRVLCKLIDVLIDTSDPKLSTKMKNVLKQIRISADQIQIELNKLLEVETPKGRKPKKSKAEVSEDSSYWQRTTVIIEVLQSKDNLDETETLLPTLFQVLSMCLGMSSQTSVEYLKQLLLSTMLKICQAHVSQNLGAKRGLLSEAHFSVEQIIRCIRLSENPQTHHHALSLLAVGAKLFPEKVLHNVMPIFTFMGVSVLRQDDTYSFQVIKKTVEAVIPALIQAEKDERNVKSVVTKVMRVFVDTYPHVPEHRRLPVFVHLLTTLGASSYLHVCLALLLEKISNKEAKNETKESGLVFCNFLCSEFSPDIQMVSLVSLLKYLATLPEEKPEGNNRKRYADSSGIVFDVNTHSGKELRQFKLCGIELILSVLGNDNLVNKVENISGEKDDGENLYLSLLEESLKYIAAISRSLEGDVHETTVKYLRVLLHKVYHVVEKVCDLLPGPAFVSIVSQLVQSRNSVIRKKSMDLFNKRMSKNTRPCSAEEMELLLSLLDALIPLIQNQEEPVVNKQSAFNTVVVLSKLLDDNHNLSLKNIFSVAIESISGDDVKVQVSSSALYCVAELCSVLKVHSIPFLPKFLPLVLQILENKDTEKRSDLLILNALTVIQKVVQSLPNFISPYLRSVLVQLVSPVFITENQDGSIGNKNMLDVASSLRADIAYLVKPRILIPNVSQCYEDIVQNKNNESLIALCQVLDSCITHMTKDDVKNYHNELLSLFMSALDYRSQHAQGVSQDSLLQTEEAIIGAFISLIMRLSESLFRPMFLKLVDWATRSSAAKSRQLIFYHLADRMAEKLKGLFVLFAGYLIKNTATILDSTNITKTEQIFFASEYGDGEAIEKSCQLLGYVLDCLHKCFLYDNQRFVNKERFDRLLQPLVDQIENQIGDTEVFDKRVSDHLAPCIAQFAVAAGDETCWKTMNHQICLKTRHSSSQVRLAALNVVQELTRKLGEEYLTLLPEIIPFLAELMEDESFEVEQKCQQVISEMEEVLGESLQKYF